MVLANAIYMNADWFSAFDAALTRKEPFHSQTGKVFQVNMMHRRNHFNYNETENLQILEIPYKGNALSILFILPKKIPPPTIPFQPIQPIEKLLNEQNLNLWKKGMTYTNVQLFLPRFKFETSCQLGNQLKKMGMLTAFTPQADFGNIGSEDISIRDVYHKALVKVEEQGTEAAAATVTVNETSSMQVREEAPKFFMANHPFIFIIQEKKYGTILFIGKFAEPSPV